MTRRGEESISEKKFKVEKSPQQGEHREKHATNSSVNATTTSNPLHGFRTLMRGYCIALQRDELVRLKGLGLSFVSRVRTLRICNERDSLLMAEESCGGEMERWAGRNLLWRWQRLGGGRCGDERCETRVKGAATRCCVDVMMIVEEGKREKGKRFSTKGHHIVPSSCP